MVDEMWLLEVRLASTDLVVKVSSRWEVQPSNEAKEPRCRDWLRGRDSLGRGAVSYRNVLQWKLRVEQAFTGLKRL